MIGVDGRLQSRRYDDKDGKTVFVTEVVADTVQFLEPKNSTNQGPSNQGQFAQRQGQQTAPSNNQTSNDPFKTDGEPIDISDDDLPFKTEYKRRSGSTWVKEEAESQDVEVSVIVHHTISHIKIIEIQCR